MLRPLTRSCPHRVFTQLRLRHALRLAPPGAIAHTNAGRRPNLGERRLTTTTDTIPRETQDDPERLSTAGQQLVDLSGKTDITIHPLTNGPQQKFQYEQGENNELQRFPENTKGFFYYHNDPDAPELCAGVRFRICDSSAQFDRGRDLLDPTGNVWGYKLPELVKHSAGQGFLSLYHYSLSEPFTLDVGHPQDTMLFATRAKVIKMEFPTTPFADLKKGAVLYPLTGAIRVRFEQSHYIEHKKLRPALVLRVLNIVRPITPVVIPTPGSLLFRMTQGEKRITRIPLKHQQMADDLLELLERSRVKSSFPQPRY
ncbi:hypothetical protein BJ912DRAFT_948026 [Pholiota molesta]|nr:hypothetical protein BJ912DRAFT_948026 [Pholiota molesta]